MKKKTAQEIRIQEMNSRFVLESCDGSKKEAEWSAKMLSKEEVLETL